MDDHDDVVRLVGEIRELCDAADASFGESPSTLHRVLQELDEHVAQLRESVSRARPTMCPEPS